MAQHRPSSKSQPNGPNGGALAGLRRFKSTVPVNYKSPQPVRVPPPPRANQGS
jgi:hypothetical protein